MSPRLKSAFVVLVILLALYPGFRLLYKQAVSYNKSYAIEVKDNVLTRYSFDPNSKNAFLSGNNSGDFLGSKDLDSKNGRFDQYYDEELKEYGFDENFVDDYRKNQNEEFLSRSAQANSELGKDAVDVLGSLSGMKILYHSTDQRAPQTEAELKREAKEQEDVRRLERAAEDMKLYINPKYVRTKTGYTVNPEVFKVPKPQKPAPSPRPLAPNISNELADLNALTVKALKGEYYSFESIGYNILSPKPINVNDLVVYVTKDDYIFPNVDGRPDYYASYQDGVIGGYVNMGYRPVPGVYNLLVKSKSHKDWEGVETTFKVLRRKVPQVDKGFSVMTMEYTAPLNERNIIGPDGTMGKYEKIADWLDYAGVNAFWMLVAQTTGWDGRINSSNPWVKGGFTNLALLAPEMKKRGIQVGAYTMTFFTPGNGKKKIKEYTASLGYDAATNNLTDSLHVSLLDERRIEDLIKWAKQMDNDPNVDYIGFDFIRTGEVDGYEMVDKAVAATNMRVPKDFDRYAYADRVKWLGRQVKVYKNPEVIAKWRWWRASRVAAVINRIITEGGIHKPVWAFTLGWEHGLQHGQDPYMMFDAGAFIDAAMLYEASETQFRNMMVQWKSYMRDNANNMIIGNSSDVRLLDSSKRDMVYEFMYRNERGYRDIYHNGLAKGLFLHDISRALWSNNRGMSTLEWMVVYGASISNFRQEWGVYPYSAKLEMKTSTEAALTISNEGDAPLKGIRAEFVALPYWSEVKDNMGQEVSLDPGESKIFKVTMKPRGSFGVRSILSYKVKLHGYPDYFVFDKKRGESNYQAYTYRHGVKKTPPQNGQEERAEKDGKDLSKEETKQAANTSLGDGSSQTR